MRLDSASMYMNNVVFVENEFDKLTQEWKLSDNLQNLINRLYSFPMVEHDDIIDAFDMMVNFVFLDKKYAVYGRSFDDKNIIKYDPSFESLYGVDFVNKEGDIWKVSQIKIKYGEITKLIVVKECEFRANLEEALNKLQEFDPQANVFIDCSENHDLVGIYSPKISFEGYAIDDFNKSVVDLNLAFSQKLVLLVNTCKFTKGEIETFKFTKTKNEEAKYVTDKDGFIANIRVAMKYFGGIV